MTTLASLADELGVTLAGSLLAAAAGERTATARRLARDGHWVHADVIEGSFRGQAGLTRGELRQLEDVADRLDIHLMVDDPVRAIARLPVVPRRLTVQVSELGHAEHLVERARAVASEVWLAVERVTPSGLECLRRLGPDGVLVMLTPPGAEGHAADLNRLVAVRDLDGARLTCGVDGGVTGRNLPLAAAAGVSYAVSGRAFLRELSQGVAHAAAPAE